MNLKEFLRPTKQKIIFTLFALMLLNILLEPISDNYYCPEIAIDPEIGGQDDYYYGGLCYFEIPTLLTEEITYLGFSYLIVCIVFHLKKVAK